MQMNGVSERVSRYFSEEIAMQGVVLLYGYYAKQVRGDIFNSPLNAAAEINAALPVLDLFVEQLGLRRFVVVFRDEPDVRVRLVARQADGLEALLATLTGRAVATLEQVNERFAGIEAAPAAKPKNAYREPSRTYPHRNREMAEEALPDYPCQRRTEILRARGIFQDPKFHVVPDRTVTRQRF
jgi:hypothetical protein